MRKIFNVFLLLVIILAFFDVVKNPFFLVENIGISGGQILYFAFLVLIFSRIVGYRYIVTKNLVYFLLAGLILFIFGGMLVVADLMNGPNFIYSKLFINTDKVLLLSLFLAGVGIIGQNNFFFERFWRVLVIYGFVAFACWVFIYSLIPGDRFAQLVKEKELVENLQAISLLISSLFAFKISIRLFSKKKLRKHTLIFIIFAVALATVFLDEISWGQQVFYYETPELIALHNTQSEVTIHNSNFLDGFIPFVYIVVGLYGLFARFIAKSRLYVPDKILIPYFLVPIIYNLLAFFNIKWLGIWSEPAELFLYAGISIHMLHRFYIQKYS